MWYVATSMKTIDLLLTRVDEKQKFVIKIHNLTNERALLADRFYGYYADVHKDPDRYFSVEYNITF